MSTASEKILVIIPAFNEQRGIGAVVKSVRQNLPEADVAVVDDGSKDRTAENAKQAGAVVLSHPFNMGYGAALQTGYRFARVNGYSIVLQMDGDGQHSAEYLPEIVKALRNEKLDVVLGSRKLGESDYKMPFFRRIGAGVFSFIIYLLTRKKFTDPTTGFQGFSSRVLDYLVSDYFPDDYPDADVLVMIQRLGYRVREIPVKMFPNEEGKSMHSGLKPVYYVFKMLLSLFIVSLRKYRKNPGSIK